MKKKRKTVAEWREELFAADVRARSAESNLTAVKEMAKRYQSECTRLTSENVALREGKGLTVPSSRCPACGRGFDAQGNAQDEGAG